MGGVLYTDPSKVRSLAFARILVQTNCSANKGTTLLYLHPPFSQYFFPLIFDKSSVLCTATFNALAGAGVHNNLFCYWTQYSGACRQAEIGCWKSRE